MSNRYGCDFLKLVEGVFKDALAIDPTLKASLAKDMARLRSLVNDQGDAVFLLHLPAIDKELIQSLDRGRLLRINLPLAGTINTRTVIPRLFQGIWMRLFDNEGCLRQIVDPNLVAVLRQILMIGAKYETRCPSKAVFKATEEFYHVESTLPPGSSIWDGFGDDLDRSRCGDLNDRHGHSRDRKSLFSEEDADFNLLNRTQLIADRLIAGCFGESNPEHYEFRHGPGATASDGRGKSYKYSFPAWSPRLEYWFPYDAFGVPNASVLADVGQVGLADFREEASRLIQVPKTYKAPRLIAAEPTCHQWLQQGIADYMSECIRRDQRRLGRCIDFTNQYASQELATRASRTGRFATIDLKSASDRLTTWLVQRIFRSNPALLGQFVATRTRYLRNDIDKKQPSLIKLRKFASMGSALTFPVQSVVFAVLSIAAGSYVDGTMNVAALCRKVRVYGDDLIVPVHWVDTLQKLMRVFWLEVNAHKTFTGKNFRESCGADAFQGYDVTPVKLKQFPASAKPSSIVSAVDSSNLLYEKGWWHAMSALDSAVDRYQKVPVVHRQDGVWGRKTAANEPVEYRLRYNTDLQLYYVSLLQPSAKKRTSSRLEGFSNLLQYFTEDPSGSQLSNWESGRFGTWETGISRSRVDVRALKLARVRNA